MVNCLHTSILKKFLITQDSPLIASDNSFGDNFDTSYAYGPMQVKRILIGVRHNL